MLVFPKDAADLTPSEHKTMQSIVEKKKQQLALMNTQTIQYIQILPLSIATLFSPPGFFPPKTKYIKSAHKQHFYQNNQGCAVAPVRIAAPDG